MSLEATLLSYTPVTPLPSPPLGPLQDPPAWLRALTAGVSAVGVALVASATKGLLMKMCGTKVREQCSLLS